MRYIKPSELERAIPMQTLIWLSNDDPSAETPDIAVLEDCVRYAEELCDGYLLSRYVLPLTSIPTVIRDAVIDLARYRLYQRRPEGAIPEIVKEGYKATLDLLTQIQKGAVSLNIPSSAVPGESPTINADAGAFRVSASSKRFDTDTLKKW